ncbi:proline dehydrogenase [Marinitenerispora sediminis]|uniref:Proline dehydrogenase n=1 Tax=Marinitenerispora sediminis TaxID=1931232 RepID=A0A368T2T1_9ACTN|nr:proline dehydrogenase [Marinitenerispora sediminis]RCV48810.1 proline dehydrogenase [Marinitenerispora sediminis]RCV49981.1 proline dehydrogenase [Marinitenerispora sediminis]RCV50744.1 proline dehydrogenase [Marinitenerispora sediminis]
MTASAGRSTTGAEAAAAVRGARALAERGLSSSLQHAAAAATHPEQAEEGTRSAIDLLHRLADLGLAGWADLIVRPRALGLGLGLGLGAEGAALAADNLARICAAARESGTRVTTDAEDAAAAPAAARLVAGLRAAYPALGRTLPADPDRWAADPRIPGPSGREPGRSTAEPLAAPGARYRLRGADHAPGLAAAHAGRRAADLGFVRALRTLMPGPDRLVVATGDPRLLEIAGALAAVSRRPAESVEYELPRRVRSGDLRRLRAAGARVRIRFAVRA